MNRRVYDSATVPFLAVREDYHPKRNQARQKLATLQLSRFKDLASDVFFEIERRFPHVVSVATSDGSAKQEYVAPQQKQPPLQQGSQSGFPSSNSLNYNYSEDSKPSSSMSKQPSNSNLSIQQAQAASYRSINANNSNADYGYGGQRKPAANVAPQRPTDTPQNATAVPPVNFSNLDSLMADLGNMLEISGNEDKLVQNQSLGKQRERDSPSADESSNKMVELQRQVHLLEDKLSEAEQRVHDLTEKNKQLLGVQAAHQKLQESFNELKRQHEDLQDDFANQQQMAKDIRQEATNLLEENKLMNRKNEELRLERDAILLESKMLKQKLESATVGGVESLASASSVASAPESNTGRQQRNPNLDLTASRVPVNANGVVDYAHVVSYQQAVSDLLAASKSDAPTTVLVAMKAIVIACKNMTENIELFENSTSKLSMSEREQLGAIKNRISMALKSLMEAAKAHAAACTNSSASAPGSMAAKTEHELKESLVYLSETISDILGKVHVNDEGSRASAQNTGTDLGNRLSVDGSDSRPQNSTFSKGGDGVAVYDIDELKTFLEKQTDDIVHAIQILLQVMRSQTSNLSSDFIRTVHSITSIVDKLVEISTRTIDTPAASQFRAKGKNILDRLTFANRKLEELGQNITSMPNSKSLKQDLASASYDIAKHVKELISLIE